MNLEGVWLTVEIAFVGDVNPCLPRTLKAIRSDVENVRLAVWGHLDHADLIVSNLETPISNSNLIQRNSIYCFSGHEDGLSLYSQHNRHIISIANNHIMDCGNKGLRDTLDVLSQGKFSFLGAGKNISAASEPIIRKVRGSTFLFIGCAEPHYSPATENESGNLPATIDRINTIIQSVHQQIDRIVVSIHGGQEFVPYPSSWQIGLVEGLIESVDVFHFHHSHTPAGMEIKQGSLILWGTGNHVFQPIMPIPVRGWCHSVTYSVCFPEEGDLSIDDVQVFVKTIGQDGVPRDATPLVERRIGRFLARISRRSASRKCHWFRFFSNFRPSLLILNTLHFVILAFWVWGPFKTIRYISQRLRSIF